MDKNRIGLAITACSAALILLTTYLALFYAPIPQAGVRAAGEILSSVEGREIRIAGFVTEYVRAPPVGLDSSEEVKLSLADFSDYDRYLDASSEGRLDERWWTVAPISIEITAGGILARGPYLTGIGNGTNISVFGRVVSGQSSQYLSCQSSNDVVVGANAGAFGLTSAPVAQKIFYFHMPSAWVSYVAFFVTLLTSVLYLRTRKPSFDRMAFSSAELGVLFATVAILTGPVWAKQEWGVYWRWDDTKLVTTFVMWLVYIGYLALRAAVSDPSVRARVSAVYGIIGFVTMPMSLLSSRVAPLLRSGHPQVIATESGGLSPEAGMTVGIAVVAFTFLFITTLIRRLEIAESEEELEDMKRAVGGEE